MKTAKIIFLTMAMFFMTAPVSNAGGLTDKEATALVKELWKGVPDHGINDYTKQCLTPDFYDLVEEGFAMPGTDPEGFGDEDFLWYWHSDGETDSPNHVGSVKIIKNTPEEIVADVTFMYFDEPGSHIVTLKPVGNEWRISEFDNKKQEIIEFVNEWGPKFRNGIADELLRNVDPEYLKNIEPYYRKAVKEYLERYGNKK